MNLPSILDRRSTRYLIALSWMAVLLPPPDEIFAKTATAAPQTTPTKRVGAMEVVFGKKTYGRVIHAKGIVLEGSFEPNPDSAARSGMTYA